MARYEEAALINGTKNFKYQWDDEHKVHFLSTLNTEDMCSKFIGLFNEIDRDLNSMM